MNRGKILVIFFQDIKAAEKKLSEVRKNELSGPVSTENILYGEEITAASEIVSLCRTPPFFGDYRLVVVRRAEKMPAPVERELNALLKTPPACAYLVMMRQEKKRGNLPFAHKWSDFPLKGGEREVEDGFGLAGALERGDRVMAFRILDHQYRSEYRDFPRFFGLLSWFLRSRFERGLWPLSERTAALFNYFYEIENGYRTGRLDGRAALEMTILELLGEAAVSRGGRKAAR